METKDERVLAYKKAKSIDYEDLKDISGGVGMTATSSNRASGGSGTGADYEVDYKLDW